MKIKRLLLSAAAWMMIVPAVAQTVWHNPLTEGDEPYVQGRAWNAEIGQNYHRFPDRAKEMVRPSVWNLSLCSSGLLVDFFTNSDEIVIRYKVTGSKNADNIPKFTKSGIDIYRIDKDGVQHWVNLFGHYDFGKGNDDPIVWTFANLTPSDTKAGDEYRVYLPMYSEVENLEIGVHEGKTFHFAPNRKERPIVVYGTSIAMGASPSRNGNAWTNIPFSLCEQAGIAYGDQLLLRATHDGEPVLEAQLPLCHSFGDVAEHELLAYTNELMNLAFTMNQCSVVERYGIGYGPGWEVSFRPA